MTDYTPAEHNRYKLQLLPQQPYGSRPLQLFPVGQLLQRNILKCMFLTLWRLLQQLPQWLRQCMTDGSC